MSIGESRMQFPVPPALEHPEFFHIGMNLLYLQKKTYLNSCSLGALSTRSRNNVARFWRLGMNGERMPGMISGWAKLHRHVRNLPP